MDCVIGIAITDQGCEHIDVAVRPLLEPLNRALSKDYGGEMEHLWIGLEISPQLADHRPPFAFRFQKLVSPRPPVRVLPRRQFRNVGHFSVRPDFFDLARVPLERVGCYLLELTYQATVVLEKKRRRLGGFDVDAFRADFREALNRLGCNEAGISHTARDLQVVADRER